VSARARTNGGSVTLEWVLVLPLVALAVAGVLEVGAIVRDALLVHDAARVGARAAATTTGDGEVRRAVDAVLPAAAVKVRPHDRRDGDVVRVTVELSRSLGPVTHRLRATAIARTEPIVASTTGASANTGPAP
jgi:Flp pilus assembly protein TadG